MVGLTHTQTMDRVGSVYCSPSLTSSALACLLGLGDRGIVCRPQRGAEGASCPNWKVQRCPRKRGTGTRPHSAVRTRCLSGYSIFVRSWSLHYPPRGVLVLRLRYTSYTPLLYMTGGCYALGIGIGGRAGAPLMSVGAWYACAVRRGRGNVFHQQINTHPNP